MMEQRKTYQQPLSELLDPAFLLSGNSYGDNNGLVNISNTPMNAEDMCANENVILEDEPFQKPTSLWDE